MSALMPMLDDSAGQIVGIVGRSRRFREKCQLTQIRVPRYLGTRLVSLVLPSRVEP
jgi:hypothetical protein